MTTRGFLRLETGADGRPAFRALDDGEMDRLRAELRWLSAEPDCPAALRALIGEDGCVAATDREGAE